MEREPQLPPTATASTPAPAPALPATPQAGAAERRTAPRRAASAPAEVALEVTSLDGVVQSLSDSGLLLVSGASLRVRVRWSEQGVVHERTGRLARVQRLSAADTGFAIEFDEPA